jgi:hypothetical protein
MTSVNGFTKPGKTTEQNGGDPERYNKSHGLLSLTQEKTIANLPKMGNLKAVRFIPYRG